MGERQYSPKRFFEILTSICQVMRLSSAQSLSRIGLFASGLQHTRLSCSSPTPGLYSNSCPLSWWCHPTVSSSVDPFSSNLQYFPASGSFQIRKLFTSSGQSIGVSTSASVLPPNIQNWLPLGWTRCISLKAKGLFIVQLSHPYMTTGKTTALTRWSFVGKVMSFLYNMLSGFVKSFPKEQVSFNFMAAVTICRDSGAQNLVCHCVPIYLPWSDGTRCRDLSLLNVEL